jgi:hypothetical protein
MKPYNNVDENANISFKTCSKCAQTKLLNEFGFLNKSQLKYRSDCRNCRNITLKEQYAKRKQKTESNIIMCA